MAAVGVAGAIGPYRGRRIRIAVWRDALADYHGLDCAVGDRTDCKGRCEHRAGAYGSFGTWDRCPIAATGDDSRLAYVIQLDHAERAGFALGHPDSYAAWVPSLLAEYRAAVVDRQMGSK